MSIRSVTLCDGAIANEAALQNPAQSRQARRLQDCGTEAPKKTKDAAR
jgi:hypothetical protein